MSAVETNEAIVKCDLGGNHFHHDLLSRLETALRKNNKKLQLEQLVKRNAEAFEAVKDKIRPKEGQPIRHAYQIDLKQTGVS